MMGYPGIAGVPEDDAALEIMHYVLAGGGFASRMMDELRTSRGLTAALRPWRVCVALQRQSGHDRRGDRGGVCRDREDAGERADAGRIRAGAHGLSRRQHPACLRFRARARLALRAARVVGFYEYTSEQYLNYYAGDERQAATIRKLTLADVNAAAKKYLRPNDAVIAIVGPVARIQKGATGDTQRYVTASK
jgi:hypothetical protein